LPGRNESMAANQSRRDLLKVGLAAIPVAVRIRFSGESESVTMTINDPDIVLIARRKQALQ
jgi:hypothetical protein